MKWLVCAAVVLCVAVVSSDAYSAKQKIAFGAGAKGAIDVAVDEACTSKGGKCQVGTCVGGSYASGLCSGRDPKCCIPTGAAVASTPQAAAPVSAASGAICLTFDDGPFPITTDILRELNARKVKATFFMNCHAESIAAVKVMVENGHGIANHMCSHEIMANKHYLANYGADMKQPANPELCLTKPEQLALFKKNYDGVSQMYNTLSKANGFSLPTDAFKFVRFPGDGRFEKCLIAQLSNPRLALVIPNGIHRGWSYEVAPTGTFGHLTFPARVAGLSASYDREPRGGDIVLVHDLHYGKGKLPLLTAWIDRQLSRGLKFGLLDGTSGCRAV
jgi:hypothetical protein